MHTSPHPPRLYGQVANVKGKAVSREDALQDKIKELEAETSRRDSELKLLRQSMLTVSEHPHHHLCTQIL